MEDICSLVSTLSHLSYDFGARGFSAKYGARDSSSTGSNVSSPTSGSGSSDGSQLGLSKDLQTDEDLESQVGFWLQSLEPRADNVSPWSLL